MVFMGPLYAGLFVYGYWGDVASIAKRRGWTWAVKIRQYEKAALERTALHLRCRFRSGLATVRERRGTTDTAAPDALEV